MDLSYFDATEVSPEGSFEPVPEGWYRVVITDAEEKPTKAQTGSYLQLTVEIVEGQYQGRKIFDRLNLKNPSQTAVNIANTKLSQICHGIGIMRPETEQGLCNRPLMAMLLVEPPQNGYGAQNKIDKYAAPDKVPGAEPAAAATATSTPPWKR
jgi:hypothetical protein